MKRRSLSFVATTFVLVLLSLSCNKDDASTGPVPSDVEAYNALENALYGLFSASIRSTSDLDNVQMGQANAMFRERVSADPTNATANFGAALTEVMGSYADPDINSMLKDLEGGTASPNSRLFPFTLPIRSGDLHARTDHLAAGLAKMITAAITDPPSVARIQTVLRTKFVPRLEYALARLAVVEQQSAFEFRITGKMQGDQGLAAVTLDLTEVYLIDVAVRALKASVDQFLVFDFTLNDYRTSTIHQALQPTNTTFFVLASDGRTRALGIKSNIALMFVRLRSAVDFLAAETDDQTDDIIKLGTGGVSSAQLQQIRDGIAAAETVFTRPQTVRLIDADTDGQDYELAVSIGAFYDNPPQNPKTQWLPTYTVDTTATGQILFRWSQQDYASFTFPDPTFSGVLPGMTSTILKRILHVDEAFGWRFDASLRDDNCSLTPSTLLRLYVNGIEELEKYQRYPYYGSCWRSQWFLPLTGNGLAATVRAFDGTAEILLESGIQPMVRLKQSDYVQVDITRASQFITAIATGPSPGSPANVQLSLMSYGTYVIERRTTGAFSAIDTVETYWYLDQSVSSGVTYQYRAKRTLPRYNWYGGYVAVRAQNYTNTVTATIP